MKALLKRIFVFLFVERSMPVQSEHAKCSDDHKPVPRLNREEQITIEHAPCPGGYHTTYMLFRKQGSNVFIPFPESNFKLTTREWQEETLRKLMAEGFMLQLKES